MSIETRLARDEDSVFPGENWFFYWKTSVSLWRTKLSELNGISKIIVPINWSFHSEMGEKFDFGEHKPETNLAQLSEVAKELGKEIIYFIPMTPAPFLQNGGLPHLLSKTISLNDDGLAQSQIGSNEELFKTYSLYDPKVFKAFSKFIVALGQYFYRDGIVNDVYGMKCGYFSKGRYHSFLEDSSREFHDAFSRYLDARMRDPENNFEKPTSAREEQILKHEFENLIMSLYKSSLEEGISANFEGQVNVNFLGASVHDSLKRLMNNNDIKKYSHEIFETVSKKMIVSSTLLPSHIKKGVFGHQLNQLMGENYINQMLQRNIEDDGYLGFSPLGFFEVYENSFNSNYEKDSWKNLSLISYLYENYRFNFFETEEESFAFNESSMIDNKIHFIQGSELNRTRYSDMLKLFMSGGQIILNRSGMDEGFCRKLEMFYTENSLKIEKVNYNCLITNIALDAGRLIIFEGFDLEELAVDIKKDFWLKLLSTFEILHLNINIPNEIQVSWSTRNISTAELNFEEIRRVDFYNISSYKKKIKVPHLKNFALLKIYDEVNVSISKRNQDVEVELLPEGHLAMDFGVYT
ncbi:MAG: hypothetical protein HN576_11390 [Bacteriovoracaceae bacterium]|nr:hypothetical protein [Bacteriovoracaceae bacterium]